MQHADEDQDEVDDEQGLDVVGDVVAPDRRADHRRIRSIDACTACSNAFVAPPRSSASRPASVLPPGEATAARREAGWRVSKQLRGAGQRLQDELARQLFVETFASPRVGEHLGDQREVGGRAAHDRRRRVDQSLLQLHRAAEQPEQRQHLAPTGRRRRPAAACGRSPPAAPRPPGSAWRGTGGRPERPVEAARPGVAPRTESTAGAASAEGFGRGSSAVGFTASTTRSESAAQLGEVGARLAPRARRRAPPRAPSRRREQHRLRAALAGGPAPRHRGGHVAGARKPNLHRREA